MEYENSYGRNLWDLVETNLYEWADEIPWDYADDSDENDHHAMGAEKFREFVGSVLRQLLFRLSAEGKELIAVGIKNCFDLLEQQAKAMDHWCEGNPPPDSFQWSSQDAADAVGDPEFRVIADCYDVIREARFAVETASGIVRRETPTGLQRGRNPVGLNKELIRNALNQWHGYKNGSVSMMEPASVADILAIIAKQSEGKISVAQGSLTSYFKRTFTNRQGAGSHAKYVAMCATGAIADKLRLLNGDEPALGVLAFDDD